MVKHKVGDFSEQEIIDLIRSWIVLDRPHPHLLGIGDDCALLPPQPENSQTVLTTDLLVENTHFLFNGETNWHGVGWKAATANISDIASMGATPLSMLIGLALPPDFTIEHLRNFYTGLAEVARENHTVIVGGDTTRSDVVIISITVTGQKTAGSAGCLRKDCRAGDYVYVTGSLGDARVGLEAIINPKNTSDSHTSDLHYYRKPRVETGLALANTFERVAMIDISDSLYNESHILSRQSGVKIELELDDVPVSEAAFAYCEDRNLDPVQFALFSGEEYELLFTLPVASDELHQHLASQGVECSITEIGRVREGVGVQFMRNGEVISLANETFSHFQSKG